MKIKIVECPRDAMQGWNSFIPTELKQRYLNQLLAVGFDTLDFGSFVSPKAIPQMRDTAEVLEALDLSSTSTKLLAIVANKRGVKEALAKSEITYLGYPLSLSETFQQRNTKRSISQALAELSEIQTETLAANKILVVYLSMGFGNPYGDSYDASLLHSFTQKLAEIGISIVALADTVGLAEPKVIQTAFETLIPAFPDIEFGAHLHAKPETAAAKIKAALQGGCRRFDVALLGFGGCPMAKDDLTGNIATETLLATLQAENIHLTQLNTEALDTAQAIAQEVFAPTFEA